MEKKPGCLGRTFKSAFVIFLALIVIGMLGGNDSKEKPTTESTATKPITASVTPTKTATQKPTKAPTEAPTAAPTDNRLEIVLKWPALGEYGKYYTFNENVEKAEESDKETIIQCFVPAGDYIVTNVDRSPWTFVHVYSAKTVITNVGWEEPAETWVSKQLKPGDSCEVTIPEGWYINLQEKDHFKLVQK